MKYIYLLLTSVFLLQACTDDGFPVPPASTVPLYTYTIDNDEFAPAMVTFTNTSIVPSNVGEATYYWNFGDGSSATQANPSHLYENSGVYAVNLVVTTSVSLEVRELSQNIVIKDPNATGTPIFYTDGSNVYSALINTVSPIFVKFPNISLESSYGMVLDKVNLKLYMSDYGADKIYKSDLDGSNFTEFRTGVDAPNGLSIDYEENRIYWDTSNGIQYADMDNPDVNQKTDFVTGQPNDPDGVSVDLVNRKLYWVNYNGGLWVKNLDGTGQTELIPGVEGGTILVIGNRIYYDEYVGSGDIRLKSANLDGTNVTTIAVSIGRVIYGIGYDSQEQKIYWGDRGVDTMFRANLDGSNIETWYVATADTRGISILNP